MQTRRRKTGWGNWLLCGGLAAASAGALADGGSDGITLDQALQGFARQSGLQLIYVADTTRGRTTGVVPPAGASASDGLNQLLAGTGLVYEFLNDRTVEIRAPGRSPLTVLQRTNLQAGGDATAAGGVAAEPAATEAANVLAEVIVTARKRAEKLLDVPVAVTVFGGEAMDRRGANSLADFLAEAPGVNFYDRGGTYKVTIRGISTSLGANETGYYLDDLPFTGVTVPIAPDVRSWDLERVEVLRGPQGTLFGEGSMGGTVRILTRDAQFNTFEAKALVSGSRTAGGGSNSGVKGTLNLPLLDDRLALRVSATREEFDGWIDDPTTSRQDINQSLVKTYRAKLRFEPGERFSLSASYWHFEGDYPAGNAATDDGEAPQGLALAAGVAYDLFGASARYDFGPANLVYTFARNDFQLPQRGSLFGGTLEASIGIKVKSHEIRLSSGEGGPLQWTLGAYRREASRNDNFQFALFGIDNVDRTQPVSTAVFGEATYTLPGMPVDLTAGLRSVKEKYDGSEANAGVVTPKVKSSTNSLNPRFIVAWRPNEQWRLYASVSKGYRGPQSQPTVSLALAGNLGIPLPATLPDDSITSYELGTKALLLGGRLQLEGAVYKSNWKDVTVRIPLGNTGFNGLIGSRGTETRGVEFSAMLKLDEHWSFTLAASQADGKYAGTVPGTGIRDGAPVDDNAKTTASASVDYSRTMFGDLRGTGRIGLQTNSRRDFPSFGPPQYLPGDALTVVNARLGLEGERWGVFLFADNLTDEDGALDARNVTFAGPTPLPATANRLRPRTVGLELRVNFGGNR